MSRSMPGGARTTLERVIVERDEILAAIKSREVLELLVEGASNQEIADRLYVSKNTVEHRVSAVYGKLAVSDRPSAMVAGRRLLEGGPARP